jgi:hypothetical protein
MSWSPADHRAPVLGLTIVTCGGVLPGWITTAVIPSPPDLSVTLRRTVTFADAV